MIQSSDLAVLQVHQIIFHDIPRNPKGGRAQPVFADTETGADPKRTAILRKRLTQVFNGGSSFPVEFVPNTASPVPAVVRELCAQGFPAAKFVERSRLLGQYLFDHQSGSMSAGLLCVLTLSSGSRRGVSVMKLDREEGADLRLKTQGGHQFFEMAVLDNLVLTTGTRLFKSALFLQSDDGFDSLACDSQSDPMSRSDVAKFWLTFLGCQFVVDPSISTRNFYEASVEFVNQFVADPIEKNTFYEALNSELKSNKRTVSPRRFATDHVKRELQQTYDDFLKSKDVSMQQFAKDIAEVEGKLKRWTYRTEHGISVTTTADNADRIDVKATQIVVRDKLQKVSK